MMMKILSLLLLLPILAFNSIDEKTKTVTAHNIDDKEVYVIHMPQAKHEVLGQVRMDEMLDAQDRMEKLLALAKEKYGEDFDAITTRDGRNATCIKFTEVSEGKADYRRASKNEVYILCAPENKFTVLTTEKLEDEFINLPFYRLISMLSNKVDSRTDCDGIILTKDNNVQYIKY